MTVFEENRRLYLVHWHGVEANRMAHTLRQLGWQVAVAYKEEEMNLKVVRQQPPKAVIVSLKYFPDNGRDVVDTLWLTNWGRCIPTIFLACPEEEEANFAKEFPEAIFTDWDTLPVVLGRIPDKKW